MHRHVTVINTEQPYMQIRLIEPTPSKLTQNRCRGVSVLTEMGIPYSKQINSAFDEVTPLVAAGFHVLRTSRNISILLAVVQILNTLLLGLAVIALLALLITVNPDLERERRSLVTPTARWFAAWLLPRAWLRVVILTLLTGGTIGGLAGWYVTVRNGERIEVVDQGGDELPDPSGDDANNA